MANIETLLYIVKDGRVLLILKRRGLGAGLYNGVGGKVEEGETPLQAAVRECEEEIGVKPVRVKWVGLLEFYNDGSLYGFVHVFRAEDYEGELKESEEAKPMWFGINEVPYDKMWEDDKYWLPMILKENKKIYGKFYFVDDWKKLIRSEIYLLKEVRIIDQQ